MVESSISDSTEMARFMAALLLTVHADWLLGVPVSSCRLRLTDDAVRVALAAVFACLTPADVKLS